MNFTMEHGIDNLSEENQEDMLRFSNAAAHFITTCKGAIRATPEYAEIQRKLKCKSGQL